MMKHKARDSIIYLWFLLFLWIFLYPIHGSSDFKSLNLSCRRISDCGTLPSLACINETCTFCQKDNDCNSVEQNLLNRCHFKANTSLGDENFESYCIEKDLFEPFSVSDIIASFITFLCTALASGGGLGGGGILVPMFILVLGMGPKHAIPLSKATIFGTAVSMFVFNKDRKHPYKPHQPLIDYDLALLLEPCTLLGTIIGVLMNHCLPSWLILMLLVVLLGITTIRTTRKAFKLHDKEEKRAELLVRSALQGKVGGGGKGRRWSLYPRFDEHVAAKKWLEITRKRRRSRQLLQDDEHDFKTLPPFHPPLNISNFENHEFCLQVRQNIQDREKKTYPWISLASLGIAWISIFALSLMRGGHGAPSIVNIECGSIMYILCTIIAYPLLIFLTFLTSRRLRLQNRLKVLSKYNFVDGDVHWTKKRCFWYPLTCTVAGIAAGLLGIGGGMVKGPLMLEMGIIPQIQVATSGFMILFTASATTLQFAIAGQFPGEFQYDYMLWYTLIGFLGGSFGQRVIGYILRRKNKISILVFVLAGVIGISTLMMTFLGLTRVSTDIHEGRHLGFTGVCEP